MAHLDALLAYLHPRGIVEGPVRKSVSQLKNATVEHLAKAKVQGNKTGEEEGKVNPVATSLVNPAGKAVVTETPPPIPMLLTLTAGLAVETRTGQPLTVADDDGDDDNAGADVVHVSEVEAVRSELSGIYHSLQETAFDPFWGSESRQVQARGVHCPSCALSSCLSS